MTARIRSRTMSMIASGGPGAEPLSPTRKHWVERHEEGAGDDRFTERVRFGDAVTVEEHGQRLCGVAGPVRFGHGGAVAPQPCDIGGASVADRPAVEEAAPTEQWML